MSCLMFMSSGNFLFAQTTIIEGYVSDSLNTSVPFVNVFLKRANENKVIAYTTTGAEGRYRMEVNEKGIFQLNFSSMSFKTTVKTITIADEISYTIDAVLKEENFQLNEVIINSEKAITIKEDTIIFKASAFKKGNEENVEDLLTSLPGINVDSDGTIRVGSKEIEKLLIEGDDLLGKNYKLLSQNLDASTIDKVEVYDNYSANRLLKGIESSDKVAINLKLTDQSAKVFGVVKPGYGLGSENIYDSKANLIYLAEKSKNYFFIDFNNIGFDSTTDFSLFDSGQDIDIDAFNNYLPEATTFIRSFQRPLELEKERSNFNNSEMISVNDVFAISEKVKVKTNLLLNWDEKEFFNSNTAVFVIDNTTNFVREDTNTLRGKQQLGKGTVGLNYDITKNQILEYKGDVSSTAIRSNTDLVFNDNASFERLEEDIVNTTHRATYTNKLNTSSALQLKGNISYSDKPQNYTTNQFVFENFFNANDSLVNIVQNSKHQLTYFEIEGEYLKRFKNKRLLKIHVGSSYNQNFYTSNFGIRELSTDLVSDFQNTLNYDLFSLYGDATYGFKIGSVNLSGKLELIFKNNNLNYQNREIRNEVVVINPELSLNWSLNENNKLIGSAGLRNNNPRLSNVLGGYVLRDFNNLFRGNFSNIDQLRSLSVFANYTLGNILKPFYSNTTFVYQNDLEYYTTTNQLTPQYGIIDQFRDEGRNFFNIKTDSNFFLGFLSSNLKLKGGFLVQEYKNIINSNLRDVKVNTFNYGLELKSAFSGNIEFHLGTTWTENRFTVVQTNTNSTNQSFMDLVYTPTKKINLSFHLDRYAFNSLDSTNAFYFADVKTSYIVKKNTVSFTVEGKNLLNVRNYNNLSINDVGFTNASYRLLPRYVLLKARIHF